VVFQADYDEIKLQKNSYGIISVMSSPLRHQNYVTIFSIWAPPNQNFWLRQCLFVCSIINRFIKYNVISLCNAITTPAEVEGHDHTVRGIKIDKIFVDQNRFFSLQIWENFRKFYK